MKPQVVAHRGAAETHAEHTAAAYRAAIDAGADALECDVRLTADGHLVCVHDRTVDRTSDGTGTVSTMTLAQLRRLDWGPRAGAPGADPAGDPQPLLTLRDLCALVRDTPRPVQLAVETKHPTRSGARVERELLRVLTEFGWAGTAGSAGSAPSGGAGAGAGASDGASPVRVMSFSTLALRRMHALAPALPLVLLHEWRRPAVRGGRLPAGVGTAGIDIALLRRHPRLVAQARAHGHAVHVWTVDDPADVDLCLDLGVDAIITDRVPLVLQRVHRRHPPRPDGAAPAPSSPAGRTRPDRRAVAPQAAPRP